ncbi:hypothetical protein AB0M46_13880 [Dactylosporangium sp. NPDC051485]|uniref:hypothetical protein n=1 Tax=Dactylosporangium sp. NPDC051485 TaxID=3154846 RepID=UPI00342E815C
MPSGSGAAGAWHVVTRLSREILACLGPRRPDLVAEILRRTPVFRCPVCGRAGDALTEPTEATFEQDTVDQIAHTLGVTRSTVYAHLDRAA